jgi:surface protein
MVDRDSEFAENLTKILDTQGLSGIVSRYMRPNVKITPKTRHLTENQLVKTDHGATAGVFLYGNIELKNPAKLFKRSRLSIIRTNGTVSLKGDASEMFANTDYFNSDINSWDVSQVTNMSGMFGNAKNFDSKLDKWDTSKVTDMNHCFYSTMSFKSDISSWNISSVKNMDSMFCTAYYQPSAVVDFSSWDLSNVENITDMFRGAFYVVLPKGYCREIHESKGFLLGSRRFP